MDWIHAFLDDLDAQIVAVYDVVILHHCDQPRGQAAAMGAGQYRKNNAHYGVRGGVVAVTSGFREICGRENIDAVVVAFEY